MDQLTQKLKDGAMQVLEVAPPQLGPGQVMVRNHFSLISAGTEASTVKTARKSLIGKAKERPQQVKQVLDVLRQQGPVQTYRAVMKKLDAYSPLGYSSAGEVVAVAPDVTDFAVGDRVACAGVGYANHAELISVPKNLVVPLPRDARLDLAAYNTLGAIALQGVRQADLRLGEFCVVIGLGLLGQLTCLLLRAAGVRVVGMDLDERVMALATQHCADLVLRSGSPASAEAIDVFTDGAGVDAVIITAATSSLEPINFAGRVLRKRGTAVVVGAVPTGFDRDPYFYRKELNLKMSCSYGPGRYDLNYEEKGVDYPIGYVRWTERRNMQAFQQMVQSGKIDIEYLTTHRFALQDAPQAYDLITRRTEPYLGILIRYDVEKPLTLETIRVGPARKATAQRVGVAFIGAGSYAMGNLLPNLPAADEGARVAVLTASGTSARSVAERYGFEFCAKDEATLLEDVRINTVFIATRHDSHAHYVKRALEANKHVFVEKPLCLFPEELGEIAALHELAQNGRDGARVLCVGFNRRFAPLARQMKAQLKAVPLSCIYRVNAGAIPPDSWIQDPTIGGGRIIGEVCHFIDFQLWLTGAQPVEVYASALSDPAKIHDTLTITLTFSNGSVGTVCYFANGSKAMGKEYIEVYQAGCSWIIRDFKEIETFAGKAKRHALINQDKGQAAMVSAFMASAAGKAEPPIPFTDIYASTLATFAVIESLRQKQPIRLPFVREHAAERNHSLAAQLQAAG